MIQDTYTKNYIKIYFWQGISLVLNFSSMFVVIPFLTSNPIIYGIYTICISVSLFLTYADFGFISAGQKYAAEYFSIGKIQEEIKVIGFSNFILLIFLVLFSICFLFLSYYPSLLISGLSSIATTRTASSLLFILAIFTPVTLLQRVLQMICGIRLEDFIIQRSTIVGSIFKIISVLWFFRKGNYDIVGYFFFIQSVNLLTALITFVIVKKKYNYNFLAIFKAIKFNKEVFLKTKNLAFTSLFMTISWILYYEMDTLVIGKYFGAKQVAIYAIGLTLLTFFRSILGILFSPFNARFNHFVGVNDDKGLQSFFLQIVIILAPVVVLPIIVITMLAFPLLLSWVGADYKESVEIAKYLVLCNLFAFITYPTGILLMSKEQIKKMYSISMLLPFVFWIGILSTYQILGLKSFAVFKMIAFILSAVVYYSFMLKYLKMNVIESFKIIFKPMILPIVFVVISCLMIRDFLPTDKSKLNLLLVAFAAGLLILISFGIQYFFSENWKIQITKILKKKQSN